MTALDAGLTRGVGLLIVGKRSCCRAFQCFNVVLRVLYGRKQLKLIVRATGAVVAIVGFLSATIGIVQWLTVPSMPIVENIFITRCGIKGAGPAFFHHVVHNMVGRQHFYFQWLIVEGGGAKGLKCEGGRPPSKMINIRDDHRFALVKSTDNVASGEDDENLEIELDFPQEASDSVDTSCDCEPGPWLGVNGAALVWVDQREEGEDGPLVHIRMLALNEEEIRKEYECTIKKQNQGILVKWFVCLPGGTSTLKFIPNYIREWRQRGDFINYGD